MPKQPKDQPTDTADPFSDVMAQLVPALTISRFGFNFARFYYFLTRSVTSEFTSELTLRVQ